MSPINEIEVSINVHEKNVCFKERLKNSLNIQNAVSFTCDIKTLPEPTASTINSGDTLVVATRGATIPEAVIAATVADPIVTLKHAVTNHANNNGCICQSLLNDRI